MRKNKKKQWRVGSCGHKLSTEASIGEGKPPTKIEPATFRIRNEHTATMLWKLDADDMACDQNSSSLSIALFSRPWKQRGRVAK